MGKVTLFLLCGFIAMIPFEAMVWFEDVPSGSKIIGGVIAASALVAFATGHRIRMLSLPVIMRVLIVVLSVLSVAWTLDLDATKNNIWRITQLLVFALLVWEFAVTYQDQLWVLRAFLLGMAVPLAMGLLSFLGASRFEIESGERFSGGGQDLNYLSYMCSVSILIATYLATNPSPLDRYLRWIYWGFAGWTAIQALLTGSRGGLINLLVTGVFVMVQAGISRRRIVTIVQVLAIVLFVYFFARQVVSTELLSRITFSGGGGTSVDEDPRFRIWKSGMEAFSHNKLLGIGSGAFSALVTDDKGKGRAPHNTFIGILVELGIVGLSLYVLYVAMLFRGAWRLPRREKLLWLGILLVTLINAMVGGSLNDKFTWFLYAMAVSQAAALGGLVAKRRARPLPRGVVPIAPEPLRPRLRRS